MKKIKFILAVSLVALIFTGTFAFAVEHEAKEGGFHLMEWVWKVINFAILVFILVYFGRGPFKAFLKNRTEAIEKTLSEARQARELAEKTLKEVEEKLRTKDAEIASIIEASRQSGLKEKEALIAEGQKMSAKMIEQAKANIEFELNRAKEAIKAEAVEVALELAEKKLKERLTPEEHRKLLEEALSKLESGGAR